MIPLEIHEQYNLVQYLELLKQQGKIILFSALPNNTYTKSWSQRIKQVKEGVRKGVPDILIVTPTDVLFIELKRTKGGTIAPEQKEWNRAINETGKAKAYIARGFDEAKKVIDQYI